MKAKTPMRQRNAMIFVCTLLITFSCFTYPIWNFSKEYPAYFRIFNLLIACSAYAEIGRLEKKLMIKKGRVAALNLGLILAGLACRFLLEFGEVSNAYNFTPANLAVHLLAVDFILFWAAF